MTRLNTSFPIVETDRTPSDIFRRWIVETDPLTGTGTPEGNVEAPLYRAYLDKTGSSGSLLYFKMQDSIAGDKKKGWVAV